MVVEEEPTLGGGLEMVLHEQLSMVVEEQQRPNICTPKKPLKHVVQKLTPKKK
jgi:hypothetical protein